MPEGCLVWRSIGQALIFTGEAVAVVMGGNIAYAFKINGITWRAAPIGLAVASFCVCLAVGLGIREPPKGRFIINSKVCRAIANFTPCCRLLSGAFPFRCP